MHYRDFLSATLTERTRKNPFYSLRAFARDFGLSPAYLSQIIGGKRGITWPTAERIFRLTQPTRDDQGWFKLQIERERVRNIAKVEACEQKIFAEAKHRKINRVPETDFSLISEWYELAILPALALASAPRHSKTKLSKWLSLGLGISKGQLDRALANLIKLRLLEQDEIGLNALHESILAESKFKNDFIRSFHRQMGEKALLAIDEQRTEERNFTNLQLVSRDEDYPKLEQDLHRFARSLLLRYDRQKQKDGDHVYSLNQQFFKLFKT